MDASSQREIYEVNTMYKKILVPVDGSPTSHAGLHEAIRLAKNQGATVRLLHVVDELLVGMSYLQTAIDYQAFVQAVRESGRRVLENLQAETRAQGLTAETELLETVGGRAAEPIVEAARRWGADLIVMGTHGRKGMARLLMGSDAELVLRSASIPVLMVPRAPQTDK
jgi:nucleotide-binding universal stress UspA family protein